MQAVSAVGLDAVEMATALLQRARTADPLAGIWEAADVQWSWRLPRRSDAVDQLCWLDDDGPVAGVLLTSSADGRWQCDPVVVPGTAQPGLDVVWQRALAHAAAHASEGFDVPVADDDAAATDLARRSGLVPGDRDVTAWLDPAGRREPAALPVDVVLVDRTQRAGTPHPMRDRSGEAVAARLAQCSLYDPWMDLALETVDGRHAGYALCWHDPVTQVGLVEPVRVEEGFQRRGLARAMVAAGIHRLVDRGSARIKVAYETDAAGALYRDLGFRPTSTTTWYRASPRAADQSG